MIAASLHHVWTSPGWTVSATIATALALALALLQHRRSRVVRAISYRLTTTPVVDVRSDAQEKIEVTYDGARVGRVDLVRWTVSNIGTSAVTREDFEASLSLHLGGQGQPLSVEVEVAVPPDLKPIAKIEDRSVVILPLLLNPGDTFTVASLIADYSGMPQVSGRIAGVRSLVDAEQADSRQIGQLRRTLTLTTAAAVIATTLALFLTSKQGAKPAKLASVGPYQVMNTSEQMPDGIYFRRSPRWNDTARITGNGVYATERVLLNCSGHGDAVGPYNNMLWYYVTNVSRPSFGGRSNAGWLNSHYIDDGMTANIPRPGVPDCQKVKAANFGPAKPLPNILATRGAAYAGGFRMNVGVSDFPIGRLPYECYDNSGKSRNQDALFYSGLVTVHRAAENLSSQVLCYSSAPFTGYVKIGGYKSNRVRF